MAYMETGAPFGVGISLRGGSRQDMDQARSIRCQQPRLDVARIRQDSGRRRAVAQHDQVTEVAARTPAEVQAPGGVTVVRRRSAADNQVAGAVMQGVYPILMTPFDEQGRIDEDDLRSVVEFNLSNGVHGVGLALGSEFLKMTEAERERVTTVVVEQVRGRVPVVVNTGAQASLP